MDSLNENYTFRLRRLAREIAFEKGLSVAPERILSKILDLEAYTSLHTIFDLATQEEEVFEYPNNFLTRWGQCWHSFKERRFPRWLKRRCPLQVSQVWAISKFPELAVPSNLVGREFVHFKVVDINTLGKEEDEREES